MFFFFVFSFFFFFNDTATTEIYTLSLHDALPISTGTPIYATGNGTIIQADAAARGYGNHVRINHGYGYITLYGHMSKINCKVGQKVKRGDVIGYVGSTGKSVGPHCHYEVRKNGEAINPVNFYFNDLTPEEYATMIELSNDPSQSLD